jgi:hypothetical protein
MTTHMRRWWRWDAFDRAMSRLFVGEVVHRPTPDPIEVIEAWWRARNAETRERGCRCGAPAFRVRYALGTTGSVPMEIWTCEAHYGVTSWWSEDGGVTWEPAPTVPGAEQWIVDGPEPFNLSAEDQ